MPISIKEVPTAAKSVGIWTGAFAWMGAVSAVSAVGFTMFPYHKVHNGFMRPLFGSTVKFTGARFHVERLAGFDPQRPSLYCQNHVNIMDGHLASYVIQHAFCGMMEAHHFKIPGYGWIMRLAKGIPVYPRASGRTAEITEAARERIAQRLSILCFPEAHRTLDGKVRPFKRGVFFMARDAGIPIVPLAVRGFYDVARKGSWLLRSGDVHVQLGPQIETAGLSDDEVIQLAELVQERIARFVEDGISMEVTAAEQAKRAAAPAAEMGT